MKRAVVIALEAFCGQLDRLPGQWGCSLGIARYSALLDERWRTGVWQ